MRSFFNVLAVVQSSHLDTKNMNLIIIVAVIVVIILIGATIMGNKK